MTKPERFPLDVTAPGPTQQLRPDTPPPATVPQQINRLIIPHIENGMESLRDDLRKVIRELAHQCEVLEAASAIILQLGKRVQEIESKL